MLCKSIDWFLYDNGLHHERVKLEKSMIFNSGVVKYNHPEEYVMHK